jgi:hypothetical protein
MAVYLFFINVQYIPTLMAQCMLCFFMACTHKSVGN